MKKIKKLLVAVMALAMVLSMVACGNGNSEAGGNKDTSGSNTPKGPSVLMVDGVEIPVDLTWDELKTIVTENNWSYNGDIYEKLGVTTKSGAINVKTSVGEITFHFSTTDDGTIKMLSTMVDPIFLTDATKVSINGLDTTKKIDVATSETFDDCIIQLSPMGEQTRLQIVIP